MTVTTAWSMPTPGMETQFIEPDVYCRLVTSRLRLERMDDRARGLRGVYDPDERVHYVVEERKLLRAFQPGSATAAPDQLPLLPR